MRHVLWMVVAALLLGASPASALFFTSTPALGIPDGVGDTTPLLDSIDITGAFAGGSTVTFVSVEVQIDHTWVGDLAIELISDDGTSLQILARAGAVVADETIGGPPFGDGSNLVSTQAILFTDLAVVSAETLGAGIGGGQNIPAGSYTPAPDGWSTDIPNFAGFIGLPATGNWTLRVGDYAGFDVGTLVAWTVEIQAVPEPSTAVLALLGLTSLAAARRFGFNL